MRLFVLVLVPGLIGVAAAAADDYVFVDSFESTDCSQPLTCPIPATGRMCIAGQLSDMATTQPMRARFNVGLTCAQDAVGGPCDLAVAAFDALQFEDNPATAPPLAGVLAVDGCGRFRIADLSAPGSGFVTIAAQNAVGVDAYTTSATVLAFAANQQVTGHVEPVAKTADVTQWSLLGGVDFGTTGALLLYFTTAGTPTSGVTASRDGGGAGTIRYFTDADAERQFVSAVATSTGANGSALVASAALGNYTGAGAETNGCLWSHVTTGAPAGVIVLAQIACQ